MRGSVSRQQLTCGLRARSGRQWRRQDQLLPRCAPLAPRARPSCAYAASRRRARLTRLALSRLRVQPSASCCPTCSAPCARRTASRCCTCVRLRGTGTRSTRPLLCSANSRAVAALGFCFPANRVGRAPAGGRRPRRHDRVCGDCVRQQRQPHPGARARAHTQRASAPAARARAHTQRACVFFAPSARCVAPLR